MMRLTGQAYATRFLDALRSCRDLTEAIRTTEADQLKGRLFILGQAIVDANLTLTLLIIPVNTKAFKQRYKVDNFDKKFQLFQSSRRADLSRIARKSAGDYSADDAGSEAWLIADDIERKRGYPVDFSNKEDQDLVLSWLYRELVSFSEKTIRFAVKIDKHWQEDSECFTNSLEGLLVAPDQFDPLLQLQAKQEQSAALELVKRSYSQAAAYVILMCRFDWDLETVAGHLQLVASTVKSRLLASVTHMRSQPSLFDRIQTIENDFVPSVARYVIRAPVCELCQQQLEWEFV